MQQDRRCTRSESGAQEAWHFPPLGMLPLQKPAKAHMLEDVKPS